MAETKPPRLVKFIQYEEPPLKAGEYKVTVTHRVEVGKRPDPAPARAATPGPPGPALRNEASATRTFAVAGERYILDDGDIVSLFPPNGSTGEFSGVLPHVLFSKGTLPWERDSVPGDPASPWLAVLSFGTEELAALGVQSPAVQGKKAKDLVPLDEPVTVAGSKAAPGKGELPANTLSYPATEDDGKWVLDYVETPDDDCQVIDLPVALFNRVAPSAKDLPFLAHIREADTLDSEDHAVPLLEQSVVLGNRVVVGGGDEATGVEHCAFLVSLENMGIYLPDALGRPSRKLPPGTDFVRLVVLRAWRFSANRLQAAFAKIAENLNKTAEGQGLTTLRSPGVAPPAPDAVRAAYARQAASAASPEDAAIIVANASLMGYVPFEHLLRDGGRTLSWYRGPLAPCPVRDLDLPSSALSDALLRLDPQTGLLDVSYAAAWQLGQLLALKSSGFAARLFAWRRALDRQAAAAGERVWLASRSGGLLDGLLAARQEALPDGAPGVPAEISAWIGRLRLLNDVPFRYLVPDPGMLPPESLRIFQVDPNWIEALVDGAFSIGRAEEDAELRDLVREAALAAACGQRRNVAGPTAATSGAMSGFLLRSRLLTGWPRLSANAYAEPHPHPDAELRKLRMARLGDDVLLCIFDGVPRMVAIHEPPEQLHCGAEVLEEDDGRIRGIQTTLRSLAERAGEQTGEDFLLPTRADQRTLRVAKAAAALDEKFWPRPPDKEGKTPRRRLHITSAQLALQLIRGVVKVEFVAGAAP